MGSINRTYIQNTKAEIESLLHTSWDLVSKRNSEIENLSQKALELANSIDSNNYRGLAIIESALFECLVKNNYYQSIKLCTEGFNLMKGEFKKDMPPIIIWTLAEIIIFSATMCSLKNIISNVLNY